MRFFRRHGPGWYLKLFGLALVDGIVVAVIPSLLEQGATVALVSMVLATAGINYIFFSERAYPLRWLVPGLLFLFLFMLWPIVYTVVVALTNWSTGNFITQPQAVEQITTSTRFLVESDRSPIADMFFFSDPDQTDELDPMAGLFMLLSTEEGDLYYGPPRLRDDPIPVESVLIDLDTLDTVDENEDGVPEVIEGRPKLRLIDIGTITPVLDQLTMDIPELGQARARTFSSAVIAEQRFSYDAGRDVLVDALAGDICEPVEGSFYCPDESGELQRIDPGWRTFIGFDNFIDIVGDSRVRGPFMRIFLWNVIFAVSVVIIQLIIGLGLAMTFEDDRMRGRGFYRSLLIIPWAAPGFIVVIVWRGLLNPSFGQVNNALEMRWLADLSNSTWPRWIAAALLAALIYFFGRIAANGIRGKRWGPVVASSLVTIGTAWILCKLRGSGFAYRDVNIPWVQPQGDWFWSKIAIIFVTVWQGFPYFFLISTGALQAIPTELKEAARVDGASPAQVFRKVTFPLLMVGIAPLIIASFAFNFNAFVNIFLLTAGGPAVQGYSVPFGETDILISFVFDLAVQGGRGGQFALAAAFTFFIFFIVATISAISFRFTKRLETIYGNL
ncbi:ABC transporter permease subunit [bacterium]|nr:ABC transporter permease subunit [bacterium]